MNRNLLVILSTGLLLAACTPMEAKRPAVDAKLDSGVNSSNGGGARTLGNTNSTAIGPNGAVVRPSNSTGAAY